MTKAYQDEFRQSIYEFVESNPGVTIHDVATGLHVKSSCANYFLKDLFVAGKLKRARYPGSAQPFRYFAHTVTLDLSEKGQLKVEASGCYPVCTRPHHGLAVGHCIREFVLLPQSSDERMDVYTVEDDRQICFTGLTFLKEPGGSWGLRGSYKGGYKGVAGQSFFSLATGLLAIARHCD